MCCTSSAGPKYTMAHIEHTGLVESNVEHLASLVDGYNCHEVLRGGRGRGAQRAHGIKHGGLVKTMCEAARRNMPTMLHITVPAYMAGRTTAIGGAGAAGIGSE